MSLIEENLNFSENDVLHNIFLIGFIASIALCLISSATASFMRYLKDLKKIDPDKAEDIVSFCLKLCCVIGCIGAFSFISLLIKNGFFQ